MVIETKGHKKLKEQIKSILINSDFDKIDTEVDFDLDNDGKIEFSLDVCSIDNGILYGFQCKDRINVKEIQKELTSCKHNLESILKKDVSIKHSSNGIINDASISNITAIKLCYVFSEKLADDSVERFVTKHGYIFWNYRVLKYYQYTSNTIGQFTKNQIMKEFGIPFKEKIPTWDEDAVELRQEDNPPMYLLGIHPSILLKISYVYRRGIRKSEAYQRIINKDRLSRISEFLSSANLLLSNPVIIVFDNDPNIQSKIHYDHHKKMLTFPTTACCAWVIDGQHRIFGFKNHAKYTKWSEEDNDKFKIPVVAFKKLPEKEQSRTFVDINYYQKRIDPSLFADLSTVIQDLKYPITWPSLLISELNKRDPWKDMIRISELDENKPITISGFAKLKLLDTLLGYNQKTKQYSGILFQISKFDVNKPFENPENMKSFETHLNILTRFFSVVRNTVKTSNPADDMWLNYRKYGLTKFTSVNSLLLVLNALLKKDKDLKMNLKEYLSDIDAIDFCNEKLLKYGRGFPAFAKIANKILRKMNQKHRAKLELIPQKRKK